MLLMFLLSISHSINVLFSVLQSFTYFNYFFTYFYKYVNESLVETVTIVGTYDRNFMTINMFINFILSLKCLCICTIENNYKF